MTYGSKAIKTEYKGITFKSLIEAKYAQKFDELGLKWEYEPMNYMLSNGLNYMPDFHFIGTDTYFEVKGVRDWNEIPTKDLWKIGGFVKDYPTKFLLVGKNNGEYGPIMLGSDLFEVYENGNWIKEVEINNYFEYQKALSMPNMWLARAWEVDFDNRVDGVCLIKCGTCDTPYFVNPWWYFQNAKTVCPKCKAGCFRGDDDDGYEIRRNAIYDVWKSLSLFDGEWCSMSFNDMREWEQKQYELSKVPC